jgi:hypothetical protein
VRQVERDAVLDRLHAQRVLAPRDRAGSELHDGRRAHVGDADERADREELVQHLLVGVLDGLEALQHVVLRLAQVEHRVRVVREELLGAVRRLLVHLQVLGVDQLALVHAFDQFHQRSHAAALPFDTWRPSMVIGSVQMRT